MLCNWGRLPKARLFTLSSSNEVLFIRKVAGEGLLFSWNEVSAEDCLLFHVDALGLL